MTTPLSHDRDSLLARLTGPAGPEISCEECFEQLDRYVEAELAGSDADAAVDRESLHALLVNEASQTRSSSRVSLHRGTRSMQ